MNSVLLDIYIPKDDTKGVYLIKPQFDKLTKLLEEAKQLSTVIGDYCEIKEISEDDGNKGVFGVDSDFVVYGDPYHIRLAIHSSNDIKTYDPDLHAKCFFQDKISDGGFAPIIHILEDQEIDFISDDKNNSFENKYPKSPRFWRIMDSGIWNCLVKSHDDFIHSIRDIVSNWECGYYNLAITHEYADLNARLTMQSYLLGGNGHGADVSPFLFHSESRIKHEREKEEKELLRQGPVYDLNQYKWRVLLLDDRIGQTYLKPTKYRVCKEDILKRRIESMLGAGTCECVYLSDKKESNYSVESAFNNVSNEGAKMVMLCVDTIEKAECALKNYKFDFILLDYLLKKSEDAPRRYGYELLKNLDIAIDKDNGDLSLFNSYINGEEFIVGPDHRYYFMFISAFTTAISERLRLSGWSRSEELWHIAEGACPTSTPQLFCYNLRKMMVKRIKDSGIENLTPSNILKIVSEIYRPAKKGETSVRKRANDSYQKVLSLLYHYNRILNDVEIPKAGNGIFSTRGSVLMTSYFQKYINMGGLLEHLVHLVHLTAFGTVRQWPEMWEENLFFKVQFADLFNSKDFENNIEIVVGGEKETKPVKEVLGALYGNIEDYILELKKLN